MKKCKECRHWVLNPPIFKNQNGKCDIDKLQHWKEEECCVEFEEKIHTSIEKNNG